MKIEPSTMRGIEFTDLDVRPEQSESIRTRPSATPKTTPRTDPDQEPEHGLLDGDHDLLAERAGCVPSVNQVETWSARSATG